MTTFNGFIRSTNATLNRMERAHNQRMRRAAQLEKARQNEAMLTSAAAAVQHYNQLIELLISVHKEGVETLNWQSVYDEPPPEAPVISHSKEEDAAAKLVFYHPSFFDNLFNRAGKKKSVLEHNLLRAKEEDAEIFGKAEAAHQRDMADWLTLHNLADGILKRDVNSYKDAFNRFNPFSEIAAIGLYIHVTFFADFVVADLSVNSNDILPKHIYTLTSTGKLSKKEMPISRFNALYQDHVCSCVLRVGRELLALLPVNFVIVNAVGDLLHSVTGRVEPQTILSAVMFPETFEKLRFESLDPSDSMQNFVHNMVFSKSEGFRPVEPLAGDLFMPKS